jgi:hypothetical protein
MRPLQIIARRVQTTEAHIAVDRLFAAEHAMDLQVVIAVASTAAKMALYVGSLVSIWHQAVIGCQEIKFSKHHWIFLLIASKRRT